MSNGDTFRRSTPPTRPDFPVSLIAKTLEDSEAGDEPTTPVRKPSAVIEEHKQARAQLRTIHEELDRLRERREHLERRRKELLAASLPPRPARSRRSDTHPFSAPDEASALTADNGHHSARTQAMPSPISLAQSNYMQQTSSSRLRTDSVPRGRHSSQCSVSSRTSSRGARDGAGHARSASPGSAAYASRIPSEQARRQRLRETPHLVVKNGMRQAAKEDSVLVMGGFQLEDQARVYTFGRERRFLPIFGHGGAYYLATDVALAQAEARATSARKNMSVYVDVSGPPGPGAYTPRYSKVSKPSPLASRLWGEPHR